MLRTVLLRSLFLENQFDTTVFAKSFKIYLQEVCPLAEYVALCQPLMLQWQ